MISNPNVTKLHHHHLLDMVKRSVCFRVEKDTLETSYAYDVSGLDNDVETGFSAYPSV